MHVDGDDNEVGGPAPADRNVVSGNPLGGVHVHSGTGNLVEGNYLGTGESGLAGFGGGGSGVLVESDQNTVKDNLSSSNFYGVNVMGDENTVQGNTLGTDVGGGASLPNDDRHRRLRRRPQPDRRAGRGRGQPRVGQQVLRRFVFGPRRRFGR